MSNKKETENNNDNDFPMMGGGPGKKAKVEKAKDFKGTIKRLLKYISKYKIMIAIVIIFSIVSTVFSILGPKILGDATTVIYEGVMNIISANGLGMDFDAIRNIIITLLILYGISALFSYGQGYLMSKVSMLITYNLRKEISEKINRLPLSYFDKKNKGEVLSYITNDIDKLSENLYQLITQVITSVTMLLGILIMMLSISVSMTFIAIAVLVLSMGSMLLLMRKSQGYFAKQQSNLGHVNGHIEEMYSNHTIIKAFNGEEKSVEEFNVFNNKLYRAAWKSQFLSGLMRPFTMFIGNMGYVAICIVGAMYATKGVITVGNIQSFVQYMRSFNQPIDQLANITNVFQVTIAAAERIFDLLNEKEEIKDVENPESIDGIEGNIECEHVHFGYNPDTIIINDFNTNIKAGQKIAIVGPTGAGKTTIVKLLMRYYDVNSGSIKIDGKDIRNFKRNELRSLFAMVLQDTWTFNGTIMENIRYGKLDATDEEVIKAAKAAQADHFINTLPNGYNMVLDEESSNVSQGEKQLLTIARALLADPKILILDEATSSVDTRTEIQIQKAMEALMEGRTSFIIAHRLSTIREADLILVLEHGDVVEQGTHKELLAKNGSYARLYNSQFEEAEEI